MLKVYICILSYKFDVIYRYIQRSKEEYVKF